MKGQRKAYLLRWNPNISPYTHKNYEEDFVLYSETGNEPEDMNWTIREYSQVKSGDIYFMAQVGSEINGIAWMGFLEDEPYDIIDCQGLPLPHKFIDITYLFMQRIENKKILTADILKRIVPEINWDNGPSGILLSPETTEKLAMEVANQLLHAEEDCNLKFDEYEKKEGVIEDIVGYLCPQFKSRLYQNKKICKEYAEDLANGETFKVNETTIVYNPQKVTNKTSIADVALLDKRTYTRMLRGMPFDEI